MQKQQPEKFCKKAPLNNFAIFTGKHQCWKLFSIQNIAKFFRAPILNNLCKRLLLTMFMKLRKVKNCWQGILTLYEKQDFSTSVSETSENAYLFVFISWLVSFGVYIFTYNIYVFTYNISLIYRMLWEINNYTRVDKKKIKSSRKEYVTRKCFK